MHRYIKPPHRQRTASADLKPSYAQHPVTPSLNNRARNLGFRWSVSEFLPPPLHMLLVVGIGFQRIATPELIATLNSHLDPSSSSSKDRDGNTNQRI